MALHMESVVDRIYEAALVPESWPSVIHDMAALAGSASGSLAMHGPAYGVQLLGAGATTDHINEAPGAWISSHGLRIARTRAQPLAGFVRMADLLSDQEIQADPAQRALLTLGLDAQSAAHIMLPSGESACFTFERSHGEGLHAPNQINILNGLRPHLAARGPDRYPDRPAACPDHGGRAGNDRTGGCGAVAGRPGAGHQPGVRQRLVACGLLPSADCQSNRRRWTRCTSAP